MGKLLEFKLRKPPESPKLPEVDTSALEAALEDLKKGYTAEQFKEMWDEAEEITEEMEEDELPDAPTV